MGLNKNYASVILGLNFGAEMGIKKAESKTAFHLKFYSLIP